MSKIQEKEHFRESESASYEGTGKTTVTILNEDVQYIMIDSFSLSGFRLNTGLKGKLLHKIARTPLLLSILEYRWVLMSLAPTRTLLHKKQLWI